MNPRKSKIREYLTHLSPFNGRLSEIGIIEAIACGKYHTFIQADRLRVAAYKIVMHDADYKTEEFHALCDIEMKKPRTNTAIRQIKVRLNHLVMQLKKIKEQREEMDALLREENKIDLANPESMGSKINLSDLSDLLNLESPEPTFSGFLEHPRETDEIDEYFESCFKKHKKAEFDPFNIEFNYVSEPLAELFPTVEN